jgi:methylated-DNA-protein-cysteine methyltransferase related protein
MTNNPDEPLPLYERIYKAVRQIPYGQVATYGQIARLVGGCSAQMIGFALAALPEKSEVPWQRVINRFGKISPHGFGFGTFEQHNLLEEEGIEFKSDDSIDLEKYSWLELN